jgi:hypothetical protein
MLSVPKDPSSVVVKYGSFDFAQDDMLSLYDMG